MTTHPEAVAIAEALTAHGVRAVTDPRSAVPPCVLVTPPARRYDLGCGFTRVWKLVCLAPGPANADAWVALDKLLDAVELAEIITLAEPSAYTLTAGSDPLPAYVVTIEKGTP